MKLTPALQMTIRITALLELILGIVFWTGNAHALIRGHILIGGLLTLAMFVLIYQAYRAEISNLLVLFSAVWAFGLSVWGLAQDRIFPEAYLWLAQVLHLLCALGAIGLAEILGGKIRKKSVV